MQPVDWLIIFLYLAVLLVVGLIFFRRNDSSASFTLGDQSISSRVHITYTYLRKSIRHVVLDPVGLK